MQGVLTYAALVLGVVLVLCALESTLHLPGGARKAMCAALLVSVVAGAGAFVFRPLFTDWNHEQTALFVETAFPEMRNGLINAIRLSKAQVVTSPAMVNEAIKEIASETQQYDFGEAIGHKALARAAACAGILAIVSAVALAFWSDRLFNSLNRILKPTSDIPALGDIKIDEVKPGDTTVVSGDDLVVTVAITNPTGRGLGGTLHYRPQKGEERIQVMSPRSEIMFACDVPGVKTPFKYRVEVGGTQSRWYRVRIVDEPQVIGITLKYFYPEYSGKPSETVKNSDGNIKALAGSVLDMVVLANKKIRQARIRIDDKQETQLVVSPEGTTLTTPKRMKIDKDGTYTIQVSDFEGYTNRNPITYYIRAEPDEKPIVKIGLPGKDTSVALDAALALGIKAADDFGVSKVELLCQKAPKDKPEPEPEHIVQAWDAFPDPKNASLAFDWKFPKNQYKIGDSVKYYVRATDNRPGKEPNVGESSKFKVEIKDLRAEKAAKQKAYFEWRSHVEKALDMQKDARRQTDALLRSLGVPSHDPKTSK